MLEFPCGQPAPTTPHRKASRFESLWPHSSLSIPVQTDRSLFSCGPGKKERGVSAFSRRRKRCVAGGDGHVGNITVGLSSGSVTDGGRRDDVSGSRAAQRIRGNVAKRCAKRCGAVNTARRVGYRPEKETPPEGGVSLRRCDRSCAESPREKRASARTADGKRFRP